MGFEDARDDFWRGRDGGPHSKFGFLRALVEHGAVMTGRVQFSGYAYETPYEGALGHAELLVLEGLAERAPTQPIRDVVIWIPTAAGKRHLGSEP